MHGCINSHECSRGEIMRWERDDLGSVIGTDIGGAATSVIRVFIRDGIIQTAFLF
jgi:hypothetical protein